MATEKYSHRHLLGINMKFNGIKPLLYLCSFVGLSAGTCVQAQSNLSMPVQTEQQVSELLQAHTSTTSIEDKANAKIELRALLALFTNLKANFSQQIVDLQGQELQNTQGNIVLQKPQMLRWSVVSPEESLIIADGNTVHNVDPFVEQVTLMDQASLTASNPLMLLISDDESQWSQVEIEKVEGDFVVRSLDDNATISLLILSFNENNELTLLSSIDKQQQRNLIAFTNVQMNTQIPPGTFAFVADSAWVIDDQRAGN